MTKKSKFYETNNTELNKHKIKKDTKQALSQAVAVLSKSKSVEDAAELLNMSSRQLRKLFIDNGMLTPSSYLPVSTSELSKTQKQRIKELYSEFGGEKAATEIAEILQINLELVQDYIKQNKITHRSLPIDEAVNDLEPDKIKKIQEVINYKVKAKLESIEQLNLKKDAEKWRMWEETVGTDLFQLLDKHVPKYEVEKHTFDIEQGSFCSILSIADFHFGRMSSKMEVHEDNDMKMQEQELFNHIYSLLSRTKNFGIADTLYLTVGSDFLNIDGPREMTTKGTPQDNHPSYTKTLVEGALLYVKIIDCLRQFFTTVTILKIDGNHDTQSALSLFMFLSAWYRNCDDVITNFADLNFRSRQYRKYGRTLLVFDHGEVPVKDIPSVILNEARELAGATDYTIYISGHHHHRIIDHGSFLWIQQPSLAKEDRWSYSKGYKANNRLSMTLVDANTGYMAEVSS